MTFRRRSRRIQQNFVRFYREQSNSAANSVNAELSQLSEHNACRRRKITAVVHCHCPASHSFQCCFNLCFMSLRFCFFHIEEPCVSMIEHGSKTLIELNCLWWARIFSDDTQHTLREKCNMLYSSVTKNFS